MDIVAWLGKLGLERYAQVFRDNEVDGDVLPTLTAEDLKDLGIEAIGHRRKLLNAIAALSEVEAPPEPAAAPRAEAERRQLTVMFCDLVGSTALSARLDPEDMREVIRAYQDACAGVITRFDGLVAKYMGDGVLAYFGYPRAHEDDAERAVRAGLELVQTIGKLAEPTDQALAARIGIATGLVVVGDLVGEGAAQEQAVVGDTPNLAARLQAVAEPGQVVIGGVTRRLLGAGFELEHLAAQALKGLDGAVAAFAVLGETALESRFEAHSGQVLPMVGRDQELALLLERWTQAEAGEGQGVLLVGEAGIGKSRITRALLDSLTEEPHTRIRYQCSPYHTDSTLWPVIQQLSHAAGLAGDDLSEARLDKLEALLAQAGGKLRDAAPLIADLIGIDSSARYGRLDLTPQAQRARTLDALVDQLIGLAARQPVLVVLEDAHWIDPTTLELMEQCLDQIAEVRVLIVLTSRPGNQPHFVGHPHMTRLSLNRLRRGGAEAIVERLSGDRTLPAEVIEAIIARTDGVPLFIEELTKTILEVGETSIPASLHDSLMARLDRIPEVRDVAQIAACIGREFPYTLLAAVAGMAEPELQSSLDKLAAAELIFRRGAPPDARYTFKHALVQDAAYQTLLKSKRRRLHARIAEALERDFLDAAEAEPELLAHHHGEAGALDRSIRYWQKAGQRAVARSANVEAVSHFRRALTLAQRQTEAQRNVAREVELNLSLGAALMATEGSAAQSAYQQYHAAKTLCERGGNIHQSFQALRGLHTGALNRGEHDKAVELASRLVDTANDSSRSDHFLNAWYAQAVTLFFAGDLEAADILFEKAISVYDPEKNNEYTLEYSSDAGLWSQIYRSMIDDLGGHRDRALVSMQQILAMARGFGNRLHLGSALTMICMLHQFRQEPSTDRRYAEETISVGRDQVLPQWLAFGRAHAGWALSLQGQSDIGIPLLVEGLGGLRRMSHNFGEPHVLAMLAQAYRQAGRLDDALAVLDEGLTIATKANHLTFVAELYRQRGCCLLSRGAEEGLRSGESDLRSAIDIAQRQRARTYELRTSVDLARLWAEQGERQKAHDLLAPIYAWFAEGFDTPDLIEAKALLDQLS